RSLSRIGGCGLFEQPARLSEVFSLVRRVIPSLILEPVYELLQHQAEIFAPKPNLSKKVENMSWMRIQNGPPFYKRAQISIRNCIICDPISRLFSGSLSSLIADASHPSL